MTGELVSIMMPAYNAEQYIEQAIDSVLAQTFIDWELVVVNDGSTDRTADILARYTDPRIKVIHQENGGESVARNTALENMSSSLVAYLDADDAYLPNHLELTTDYLYGHPERDGVYSDGIHINETGERLAPLSSRRRGPFEGNLFEPLVWASDVFGPPSCVVLRREPITSRGLRYDPRIVIGPDWDFFIRYAEDTTFGYIDEQTCLYRVHQTNISVSVGLKKRAEYLALCREKAIKRPGFPDCTLETRSYVFYDLLVNLLTGYPERQNEITTWDEFEQLPPDVRARLYRLMASEALVDGLKHEQVHNWLQKASQLNPADGKNRLLARLYQINPWLCQKFLHVRRLRSRDGTRQQHPFHDLAAG